MSPLDVWYLHRERLLVAVGVLLGVASVLIAVDGASTDSSYETGRTAGVAMRGIAIGVIVASVGHWLIERFYWRDSTARLRLPPEGVAVAGVIAIAVSLALGPGALLADGPRNAEEFLEAAGCDEPGPVASMPAGSYVEMNERQVDRMILYPNAPQEIRTNTTGYAIGSRRDPGLVGVIGFGEDNLQYDGFLEDYALARKAMGETSLEIEIAGKPALQAHAVGTSETWIYIPIGCNLVSIGAKDHDSAIAHAESVMGGESTLE